jgi:hypothetical protein
LLSPDAAIFCTDSDRRQHRDLEAQINFKKKGFPGAYPYTIHPLRVFKKIVTMFCSACGPSLHVTYQKLRQFVLQKHQQYVPHDLRSSPIFFEPNSGASTFAFGRMLMMAPIDRSSSVVSKYISPGVVIIDLPMIAAGTPRLLSTHPLPQW